MDFLNLPFNDEVWLLLSNETVASGKCWWSRSCISHRMLLLHHFTLIQTVTTAPTACLCIYSTTASAIHLQFIHN